MKRIQMKQSKWLVFVKEEWLLSVSLVGVLSTSVLLRRIPDYDASDYETLYALLVLFAITAGLQKHNVLTNIASGMERGNFLLLKLLLATFAFSMVVTNDVALLAIVPVTLSLHVQHKEWIIILETLAANAGSALSPFGNPQNLFLYWHYRIPFWQFVSTIAPFSLSSLGFLIIIAFMFSKKARPSQSLLEPSENTHISVSGCFYIGALVIFILAIIQVLPLFVGWIILSSILVLERGQVQVDYLLLVTFILFFGFTDNLQVILSTTLAHPHHVFLLSALLSQVISNVPAALLVADFTNHWQALLWGTSVGGFGSLIGSLANLIAYRLYKRQESGTWTHYVLKFHVTSYMAFFAGWVMYLGYNKFVA